MATTEITPSPEQVHSKGEDLDVLKLNSQRGHADDAKEVDVSKISSERQPSVPNENTSSAPTREKHTHQVKEEVSSSIAEKELKIKSKAANRGKPAYDRKVKGKQTGASPQGSALGFSTDEQPAAAGPRNLHIKDHVVVCSEHESEHTYAYREAEEVSEGYEEEDNCSHDYNKPEDVYRYKVPEEVSKAVVEESCSDDKPEDPHGHKDSEDVSFAYRAKASARCASWTGWFDRDDPTGPGTGDWETLTGLRKENPGRICRAPTDIQARVISTGQDASLTGEQFAFYDTTKGLVCRNEDQKDSTCLDYGARFCCPDGAKLCQHGWTEHNSHCYKFMTDHVRWSDAHSMCGKYGAGLASITSQEENDFIQSLISKSPSQEVWIGLRKDGESWTWCDGSPVTYSNWNPGEPNNAVGWILATEACVAMYSKTRKTEVTSDRSLLKKLTLVYVLHFPEWQRRKME
ncbi:uncharacterized protein LOC118424199 [Branchiostoma floridae]|uniref:Uncharacterized protein LOC118424199 n=1 Tax=Branchiostoma floridae TaxID=7739 RepID=A0A9J7LST9_BRAFL|nr:uncharacterized protein LOC118424199 [Branchiostoma floridae]